MASILTLYLCLCLFLTYLRHVHHNEVPSSWFYRIQSSVCEERHEGVAFLGVLLTLYGEAARRLVQPAVLHLHQPSDRFLKQKHVLNTNLLKTRLRLKRNFNIIQKYIAGLFRFSLMIVLGTWKICGCFYDE